MSERSPDMPQLLCGRYVETDERKQGAQATVTKAFDVKRGREVALKRMIVGRNAAKSVEGFQREVKMLEDLRHDNIVEFVAVERDDVDGSWFIALEWLPDTLEDVIQREGGMAWARFWDRFGAPLLDAIVYAQSRRVAHRDIKPRNILITPTGVPKLADYGIAKFVDLGNAWAVSGETFRHDHTPGYTPTALEDPIHNFAKDCFGFAAVAASCLTGTINRSDEDLRVAMQEAALPAWARPILETCISSDPVQRPAMASLLRARLEQAEAETNAANEPTNTIALIMSHAVRNRLDRAFELAGSRGAEAAVLEQLGEHAALSYDGPGGGGGHGLQIVGVEWAFRVTRSGRNGEALELASANEVGASLASALRERSTHRRFAFTFDPPDDRERAGAALELLVIEAEARHVDHSAERAALAEQRIFKIWRSYLRDRADVEAKRKNAIRYVDRTATGDSIVFATEIAQNSDVVGQDRVVTGPAGRVTGRITFVAFNRIGMEIRSGDPRKVPRRGEIAINTIAAQRALDVQGGALDAVVYERSVNPRLKQLILDPRTARPCVAVPDVEPTEADFDPEKTAILRRALGMQDVLAIEGPPGTGKTKLITEIVVQWLKAHPGSRILLSSQTHIAIDNVIERVAELAPDLDIIRIGRADEERISDFGRSRLLEHRVEGWIAEVKALAATEMKRWATVQGIDLASMELGMKVERLIAVLGHQADMRAHIAKQQDELAGIQAASGNDDVTSDDVAEEEEATELDGDIAACRRALRLLVDEEREIRSTMATMGAYALELSESRDRSELAEWADHLLPRGAAVETCRERLSLLEAWSLRVGRSSDFNAAMLASAQIIAGTCVGVAGVRGMQEVEYDLCIVDEASKATATEILCPMVRGRKWIIVGDPRQLPPFFEEFGEELKGQADPEEVRATLLDRFLKADHGLPEANRAMLRNQYRMITPIGDLISECFYDGSLVSPVTSHGLKLTAILPKPIIWRSTHHLAKHAEQERDQSFQNVVEMRAIRAELKRLQFVSKAQDKRVSVAVIAGYTAQVAALREMISQGVAEWADIEVECNTVDAFQGRQADVCIYSVVRSNHRRNLGFLREPPRLNVALSRGKSALVIVGDFVFCRGITGRNPFRAVTKYIDENERDCLVDIMTELPE